MVTNKTTIILGAGASRPYGFPLGSELRDEVLRLKNSLRALSLLQRLKISEKDFEKFYDELSTSGNSSVDAFLEDRPKWTQIGKSSIAICLLAAEKAARSRLFPPKQPKDHWYQMLWSRIKTHSFKEFINQPLNIISFNYDRSLEHYLAHVITNKYSVALDKVLKSIPIVHVHGSLGKYNQSEFERLGAGDVKARTVNSIQVVHETDVQKSEFVKARKMLSHSERVLFIGFGYLDSNMRKLGFGSPRNNLPKDAYVFGTHRGIKLQRWRQLCDYWGFSPFAKSEGNGSMADFIGEWIN